MTKEDLTMSILSQRDQQIAYSEPSNIGNREIPRRASSPAKSLPPPVWSLEQCGVGFDGQTGCRVCVDTCPYEAIRTLTAPDGLRIHIDPGLCQRCGACTSACPTSVLRRAFMPDQEIDAQIADALSFAGESPVILFVHEASWACLESMPADLPLAVVTLPSLLILNETHLLYALQCGARGAAIIGHPAGHHDAPHFFETPLRIARAALPPEDGGRLAYVEDDGTDGTVEFLARFVRAVRAPAARESNEPMKVAGGHRERFAALTAATATQIGAAKRLEDVPFGEVAVAESGCTLCSACSRVCPTGALDFQMSEGRLGFRGIDCIGCGLCQQACPEHVLTLTPGLRLAPELVKRRTLVEDEVLPCRVCGAPHLPKRLLDHARKVVSGTHPQTLSMQQIDLCPSCRSVEPEAVRHRNSQAKGGCASGRCGCSGSDKARYSESTERAGMSRRDFIGGLSVTLGGLVALATGKAEGAQPAHEGSTERGTKRLGMVIDLERCIGCHACTVACKAENNVPLGVFRDWVEEHVLGEYPHAVPRFLPKLCNQCSDPGCLRACPTGALFMRPDGIVDMNHDICIACRACNQACPYGVPFMDPVRGTADKCNFCSHRVDEGLNPACVDICPSSCRIFGDLNDPESAPSRALRGKPHQVLRQELGLGPNVRYLGLAAELDR